ncbi:MAG: hypothetical protein WCD53_19960 [Microcoleus sp.]
MPTESTQEPPTNPSDEPTPEPKDPSEQISDAITGIWANIESLTGANEVRKLMEAPQDWLMSQSPVQALLNHPECKTVLSWLETGETVKMFPKLIGECGIAFLETAHGINRAYNSRSHGNLAGAGEAALTNLTSTSTEQGIYGDAVNAFNESLNLPFLSKTGIQIQYSVESAWTTIEAQREEALRKARELRDKLYKELQDKRLKLKERRQTRARYNNVAKALIEMGDPPMPSPKLPKTPPKTPPKTNPKTPPKTGSGTIIAQNMYEINSIYNDRISSIRSIKVNASALVVVPVVAPIVVVGGAIATVGATAGIIASIANWFLGTFMNLVGLPSGLLPALTNCITAIVLKVSGSSGANALRFFAASALKANAALLMKVFGTKNMNATCWIFLLAMAVPILLVSVIIILAMKNKSTTTFSQFYVLAEHDKYPGFVYASIQNANDAKIEFSAMKKDLLAIATVEYDKISGVGMEMENDKLEVRGGFNLSNETPVKIPVDEAKKLLEEFSEKHSVSFPMGAWKTF